MHGQKLENHFSKHLYFLFCDPLLSNISDKQAKKCQYSICDIKISIGPKLLFYNFCLFTYKVQYQQLELS